MAVTPRQEKFAQEVANGHSQAEAYRIAYPKSQLWKEEAVWSMASKLMRNVSQRVDELRAQLEAKALWSREDSVRTLLANMADPEAKPSDKNAAVKILNEMHGYNAPVKHDINMRVTAIERRVIDVQ